MQPYTTNTLAIHAQTHEKRSARAFPVWLVYYTTHARKCDIEHSRAFQSMCVYGGQVYAIEGQTYYGTHTVTHMQYIGSPLAQ